MDRYLEETLKRNPAVGCQNGRGKEIDVAIDTRDHA